MIAGVVIPAATIARQLITGHLFADDLVERRSAFMRDDYSR